MGFFSFLTQDTNESIPNVHSGRELGTIYIHEPSGKVHEIGHYNGYGRFNRMDFFYLMDRINRKNPRALNPCDDEAYEKAVERGHRLYYGPRPGTKFVNITRSKDWTWRNEAPQECPLQGFFYGDESDAA